MRYGLSTYSRLGENKCDGLEIRHHRPGPSRLATNRFVPSTSFTPEPRPASTRVGEKESQKESQNNVDARLR